MDELEKELEEIGEVDDSNLDPKELFFKTMKEAAIARRYHHKPTKKKYVYKKKRKR